MTVIKSVMFNASVNFKIHSRVADTSLLVYYGLKNPTDTGSVTNNLI